MDSTAKPEIGALGGEILGLGGFLGEKPWAEDPTPMGFWGWILGWILGGILGGMGWEDPGPTGFLGWSPDPSPGCQAITSAPQ